MRRGTVPHKRLCDWAITRADQPAAGGAAPWYPFAGSADESLLAALAGGLTGRRLWYMPPISRGFHGGRPQVDATRVSPGQRVLLHRARSRVQTALERH